MNSIDLLERLIDLICEVLLDMNSDRKRTLNCMCLYVFLGQVYTKLHVIEMTSFSSCAS